MSKTTSPTKTTPAPEAKRMSFFPSRPQRARYQKFNELYEEREGLNQRNPPVHATQKEVFGFLLDCAEAGLPLMNGHKHPPSAPTPPDKRGRN